MNRRTVFVAFTRRSCIIGVCALLTKSKLQSFRFFFRLYRMRMDDFCLRNRIAHSKKGQSYIRLYSCEWSRFVTLKVKTILFVSLLCFVFVESHDHQMRGSMQIVDRVASWLALDANFVENIYRIHWQNLIRMWTFFGQSDKTRVFLTCFDTKKMPLSFQWQTNNFYFNVSMSLYVIELHTNAATFSRCTSSDDGNAFGGLSANPESIPEVWWI